MNILVLGYLGVIMSCVSFPEYTPLGWFHTITYVSDACTYNESDMLAIFNFWYILTADFP